MNLHEEIEVIKTLVETNSYKYNLRKSVEELLELAEVLMKKVNKKGGPKEPSDLDVVEEIGDVQIRLDILKELFGHTAVRHRMTTKLTQLKGYIDEDKYKGSR